jgi:Na+-transporting methylmalonyl-CoA/oxaloacetate decarboxylase gamma subunit
MIDWGLAVEIAAGGFGMVFFLLVVLALLIMAGARLVARSAKEKDKA